MLEETVYLSALNFPILTMGMLETSKPCKIGGLHVFHLIFQI